MTESSRRPGYMIDAAVFLCGAVVMIYEIIGSRIVSPFIGTSTYVWTSLIGVILGALSLGYWLGGRMADRKPDVKILASAIFAAGGLVSLTILCKEIVLGLIASAPVGLEIKSVVAALLLFAPASVALGFVTPYAVRLRIASLADSGKTVGRLYALSTVGSILGTFAAGFFLIPFVGSVRTLYLLAGTLFVLALSLAAVSVTRLKIALLSLFAFGIAASEFANYQLARSYSFHDIDTEYNRVQVFETREPRSGRPIRAMMIDPHFVQSAVFPDSDELVFDYNKYYHLIRHLKPGFRQTLMIGGAGYTFPQDYLRTYPEAAIDVVEIDPGMTEIARKHFRLRDNPRLRILHEDGRVFLNNAPSGIYDAVLMDAFGSLFSVPYQLTTIEAVRQIHRVLKDDGVVVFNLGAAITGPGSRFLQAEFATYREVFPNVCLFKVKPEYIDNQLQNLIIAACKAKCPQQAPSADSRINNLLSNRYSAAFPIDYPPLTDDHAPVEYYNSFALKSYGIPR